MGILLAYRLSKSLTHVMELAMSQIDENTVDGELIPGNEIILLPPEAFDRFEQLLEAPAEPNQALIDLMNRPKPWA